MVATHVSKDELWLQRLCSKIGFKQQAVRLECDCQSVMFMEKYPTYHSKIKHIDVQSHFVKDMVERRNLLLDKVDTLENIADSLTKYMSNEKLSWCRVEMEFLPWIVELIKTLYPLYAKKTISGRMTDMCYILCKFTYPYNLVLV